MADSTNAALCIVLKREATPEDEEWLTAEAEQGGDPYIVEVRDASDESGHGKRELYAGVNDARVLGTIDEWFEHAVEHFGDEIHELLVWEDPAYEFLGTLYKWRPTWAKRFEAQCDSDGSIVLDEAKLHGLMNGPDPLGAIRRELGWDTRHLEVRR